MTSLGLDGPSLYDEYLAYTDIDDFLNRKFFVQPKEPHSPSNAAGGGTLHTEAIKHGTAFVIMAMDPERPELIDVLAAIREVSKSFGITAYRADEIEHSDRITDRILQEIRSCEYLIGDLTYERPNVYYEVGYAHAINKKPILYRRRDTKLHFDLSVHNVLEYKNISELRVHLHRRFEAILGRGAKATS